MSNLFFCGVGTSYHDAAILIEAIRELNQYKTKTVKIPSFTFTFQTPN